MCGHIPNWDILKIKTEFAVNDRNDQVAKNNFKNLFLQGNVRYTNPLSALILETEQCAFYDVYMNHSEPTYKIGFYQHARFSWFEKVNTSRVPAGHCHPTYLLPVLLSEHKELIHWYAQYIFPHCSIGHGNDKIYCILGSFEHRSYTLLLRHLKKSYRTTSVSNMSVLEKSRYLIRELLQRTHITEHSSLEYLR